MSSNRRITAAALVATSAVVAVGYGYRRQRERRRSQRATHHDSYDTRSRRLQYDECQDDRNLYDHENEYSDWHEFKGDDDVERNHAHQYHHYDERPHTGRQYSSNSSRSSSRSSASIAYSKGRSEGEINYHQVPTRDPEPELEPEPESISQALVLVARSGDPMTTSDIAYPPWIWNNLKQQWYFDCPEKGLRYWERGPPEPLASVLPLTPPSLPTPPKREWDDERQLSYWRNDRGKRWQYEDKTGIPYPVMSVRPS